MKTVKTPGHKTITTEKMKYLGERRKLNYWKCRIERDTRRQYRSIGE